MNADLFAGELVRLAAPDVDKNAESLARWTRDSEYMRLFGSDPIRPATPETVKRYVVEELENDNLFLFFIRTLAEDRLIGSADLSVEWSHGEGWIGIGLGEREYWSRGCGTDAMRVLLRYAFDELNLQRVSLNVFDYNARAMRVYEKLGFVVEGRLRQWMLRDGQRFGMIYMGLLREEWEVSASVISQQ